MALIIAHLKAGVILVVAVQCWVESHSSPIFWDLGPCQYLFGDDPALNYFNQTNQS